MGKKAVQEEKPKSKNLKSISGEYFYAVGRRKTAVATARVYPNGKGIVIVNDIDSMDYFKTKTQQTTVVAPLALTSLESRCDVTIHVKGGGLMSQSEAIRHAIARALLKYQEDLRPVLKQHGLLTRDARKKERKKPGLKRARRAPQWAKR